MLDVDDVTIARPEASVSDRDGQDNRTWRTSRGEMERRWSLVRDHLRDCGLQALVVYGYEEKVGGYVRWLTDIPPGYPRYLIFHVDDHMTLVDHGPQGETRRLEGRDPNRPGIGELVTNWALVGGHYTHGLGARSVADVIQARGYTDIGVAGLGAMPHGFVSGLVEAFGRGVRLSDETDFLDTAKAAKSAEEIERVRATAAAQDAVFAKLLEWIEPGVRDLEVNAFADYQLQLLGADRGVYIGVSAPIGQPAPFGYRSMQGRTMGRGDHMNVLLESNGLGGVWTELGRMISFGPLPSAVKEAHAICVEAQALTAGLCNEGAPPAEIFERFNTFMQATGSQPERRMYAHGQGYDTVERPFVRSDETMCIPARANLAIHPTFSRGDVFATLCDGFVTGSGGGFLHATRKQVFEL